MNPQLNLSIKMFGAFRKYHPGTLDVSVPEGSTVSEVKSAMVEALRRVHPGFADDDLVSKSVLADNQRILDADERMTAPSSLAILPPVCGG
jgi:molybdopterin converting factor small subunit